MGGSSPVSVGRAGTVCGRGSLVQVGRAGTVGPPTVPTLVL